MIWLIIPVSWALGVLAAWLIIGGGTRKPSPEPVRPLDELADLSRVA